MLVTMSVMRGCAPTGIKSGVQRLLEHRYTPLCAPNWLRCLESLSCFQLRFLTPAVQRSHPSEQLPLTAHNTGRLVKDTARWEICLARV